MTDALYEAEETATKAVVLVMGILDTLTPEQRRSAVIEDFADPRRLDWDIIPKPDRTGLSLHNMDRHQKVLVWELVRIFTPLRAFTKVLGITQLENILREYDGEYLGPALQSWRTSDSYFMTIYGRPGFEDTWMFRFLGHHVCLNVTVVDQKWISATPMALGQQPVRYGGVLAPLQEDEHLGFEFMASLSDAQRAVATIHTVAPADFVTRQVPRVGEFEIADTYDLGMPQYVITDDDRQATRFDRAAPRGIKGSDLKPGQRKILAMILECYLDRLPEECAVRHKFAAAAEGVDDVYFAWAGAVSTTASHYFRVQAGKYLIESVNAISDGDHLHTVLRDLDNDFGHHLLVDERRKIDGGQVRLRGRRTSSSN